MWLSALGTPAAGSSSSSTCGFKPERDRKLDQPLAAVGQLGDAAARIVGSFSVSSRCIASSITSWRRPAGWNIDGAAPTRSATAM